MQGFEFIRKTAENIFFVAHSQTITPPLGVVLLFGGGEGQIRKDGTSAHTGAIQCPVDTGLVRGRIHGLPNAGIARRRQSIF